VREQLSPAVSTRALASSGSAPSSSRGSPPVATRVAAKTYRLDADLERVLPTSLLALQVAAVGEREIARCFEHWISEGLAERTASRYRARLSSFFSWCANASATS
jgi:site-specific recombinase XerD